MMKTITISVDVPSDLLITLNESEQELKSHFQTSIAIMLFREGKLSIGKAIQLSGLNRFAFEKALAKYNVPISDPSIEQIESDVEKLENL